MILLVVVKPTGKIEAHIADTDQQLINALFQGKPPAGLKLEDIKHMAGATLVNVDKVMVYDSHGNYSLEPR